MYKELKSLSEMNKNTYKIDSYINKSFNCLYKHDFESEIYLIGGAVRSLLIDKTPKDLDVVIVSDSSKEIEDFIEKFNLNYSKNSFGGFKISHNGIQVDIWATNDLFKAIQYNLDGLFYNLKTKKITSMGYFDGIENKKLFVMNDKLSHPDISRDLERKIRLKNLLD